MPVKDHLEKLPVFEAVCRLKSFSLAARDLHLSQPAVSKNISALEKELGMELISRSRKGVSPTVEGLKLLQASKAILAVASAFDQQADQSRLVLKLGTKEPIAAHLMAEFMGSEMDQKIELIVERSNADLISQLAQGELHLLVIPESKFPQNVRRSVLFTSRWAAYTSPTSNSKTLIVFPETLVGKSKLEDYMSIEKSALKVQSLETALVMAVKGLGIAILPSWVTRDQLKLGKLIEKEMQEISKIPETKICAVTLRRTDPSVSSIVKRLRQHCSRFGFDS